MSIFISIASYRDPQLMPTIRSLIDNADNPRDLHFGIVSQDLSGKHPKLKGWDNTKVIEVHARDAKGAGYARKLATELYDGQDYFFQTDSHMRFAKGWDTKLKNMLAEAQEIAGTGRVILSQFPAPFEIFSDNSIHYIKGDEFFWDDVSWTSVVNTYYGAWAGNREVMEDKSKPHKSHTVLGAMIFAPGYIAHEIPYDERISFMGEELCYAIRAYTRGWEIYAPNEMVAWHYYKRTDHPKIWGDKKAAWFDIEKASKDAQKSVLLGEDNGVYGIGNYDRYLEYQEMIGINFHDFYDEEREVKPDLEWVSEEIVFDFEPTLMSGPCLSDKHEFCSVDVCVCDCHKEK